jgi:hypothetical protein
MEHSLIDQTKIGICFVMVALTLGSLVLTHQLNRLLTPLLRDLERLHLAEQAPLVINEQLERIKQRYVALCNHVDDVDTAEFSAGEIGSLKIRFLKAKMSAAGAQSWLRQAPSLLISLGLLGTFAGLTVGLGQLSETFAKQGPPAETITGLKNILAPMGAAFETSLLGLSLSLVVLIAGQLCGCRDGLDRCEVQLSSWLETVLPTQLGVKLITPLRQSIENLNTSIDQLPSHISIAIQNGMKKAFSEKLDAVFNIQANLATEAQTAIRQLTTIANALQDSGEDLLEASQLFRHSDFASSLRQSADHLQNSGELLSQSSDRLAQRMAVVRDHLTSTQSEWTRMSESMTRTLQQANNLTQQFNQLFPLLQTTCESLQGGTQSMEGASKQLRQARLEVMRDRQLASTIATTLQERLRADASLTKSCQTFASALEAALSSWNKNVERLDLLSKATIESMRVARSEEDQALVRRAQAAEEALDILRDQLRDDLGFAVEQQREAITALSTPTEAALELSQGLLLRLEELQHRLANLGEHPPRFPTDPNQQSTYPPPPPPPPPSKF